MALAVFLLLVGLSAWFGSGSGEGAAGEPGTTAAGSLAGSGPGIAGAEPGAGTSGTGAGDATLPADLPRRLRARLTDLAGLFLAPDGTVHEARPGPEVPGWREALSPDPVDWPGVVRVLPELRVFRDWLLEGGRVEELSPAFEDELRRTDDYFAAQDLPRPFAAYLDLAPASDHRPFPHRLDHLSPDLDSLDHPATVTGWAAVALEGIERTRELDLELEEELQRPREVEELAPAFREAVHRHSFAGTSGLRYLLEMTFVDRPGRVGLQRWVSDYQVAARATLHAVARSLEEEPATRDLVALYFARLFSRMSDGLFSAAAFEDSLDLFGRRPTSPAAWMAHAEVLRKVQQVAREAGREETWRRARTGRIEALEAAFADEGGSTRARLLGRSHALGRLLEIYREELRLDDVADLLDRERRFAFEVTPHPLPFLVLRAEAWLALPEEAPFPRAEVEAFLARVEELRERSGDFGPASRKRLGPVLEQLRARLAGPPTSAGATPPGG